MSTRIVICDDEIHITRAVQIKLSRAGFDVEACADGQAAWEAIRRETPALLITDYQMPRMDGLSLCRKLRSEPETCALPIILLTAKGYELDGQETKAEFGVVDVVVKPFSPRELLQLVVKTLAAEPAATAVC